METKDTVQGRLITLEGGEGAGKTTALKSIRDVLDEAGIQYILTREPGGTPEAEAIRDILLKSPHLEPLTELLLMFASRREHVAKVVAPALRHGQWVVSDRYVDASYAYQGGGRGISLDLIAQLDKAVVGTFQPDLTFLLDIAPEIGMQRIQDRQHTDRIENEQQAFFERVQAAYRQRASEHPERFRLIDASKPIDEVQADIKRDMRAFLKANYAQQLLGTES